MLHQGSALLWQESMCREWYTLLLEPWVHYIPVDYHWAQLHAATRWALDNPNRAAEIASRARAFAEEMVSADAALVYATALLREYLGKAVRPSSAGHQAQPEDGQGPGSSRRSSSSSASGGRGSESGALCSEVATRYVERTREYEDVWAK